MKKMPTGVVTTRADGAQWQKQEEPGKGPWRQVKDGSKNTQGRAKQNQMEAAEGTASEEMKGAELGYQLMRSKYDLDGHLPPDELHPDHVSVDTDGDMDSKPVLSWEHGGKKRNSYTVNFHQRRHRQTFAEMKKAMPALREAPDKLMKMCKSCKPEDKDRYLAAYSVVKSGHTPDQMLAVQRGHVGMGRMAKSGKAKTRIALQHAQGHMFQWEPDTDELATHYMSKAEHSPTAPMFSCSHDCVRTAMEEAGLGGISMSTIRAHVATRMAADFLSKAPTVKVDAYGAGMNKVAANIMAASNRIGAHFGHDMAKSGMSFVPPHVQAAYLESVGGSEHYRNTYDKLNMRKSVRTQEEEAIWQSAQEQVLKSIPSTMSADKIPSLVLTMFETMLTQSLTSTPSNQNSTPSPESLTKATEPTLEKSAPTLQSTRQPRWLTQQPWPLSTPQKTQATESTSPTPQSGSLAHLLTSSSTTPPSALTGSPTEASTSTSPPPTTTGPSLASPSSCQTETSIQKSGTATPCSPSSPSAQTIERPREVSDLMAKLVLMKAQGTHVSASALAHFLELYDQANTETGVLRFMTSVAEYVGMVSESLTKAGSMAGVRGDPIGHITIHSDGTKWRKLAPGKWARMGSVRGDAKKQGAQGPKESVRVQALRARLRKLRDSWKAAASTQQRAAVIKQLTSVKREIRSLTSDKRVKKSVAAGQEQAHIDVLYVKAKHLLSLYKSEYSAELVAKGEGFVPPEGVRSAARRGLELRRKHKRGGLDTKQAKKAGVGSGVQRASDLSHGEALSIETVKRMKNFFSRHSKYKEYHQDKTSAAYISWLLWGGTAGQRWAEKVVRQYEAKKGIKKSLAPEIIAKGICDPRPATALMDDYVRETCELDYRNTLGAQDYILRMLRDGGRTAVELQTFLLQKGAPAAVKHIEHVMKEVRDGRA
jgi:hypothetical protein